MISFILVPTDFTEATDKALQHAVFMANYSNSKIYLLNLCEPASLIKESSTKLDAQISTLKTPINIEAVVRVGNYKSIPLIAQELAVELIFLGTHGAHGMQKIMGSNALKIVTRSEIPFIIVQKDSPLPTGYNKILAPTNIYFENKQKIMAIATIAKYFKSKVFFIYSDGDPMIKERSLRNLNVMARFLTKKRINYEKIISSGENFNHEILETASDIDADIIAIMNMQKDDLLGAGLFGKHYEQEIIMNKHHIPVLILNPIMCQIGGSAIVK